MLDDGEIKRLDNASVQVERSVPAGKKESAPLIKGPLVDYVYVVDEEEFFDGEDIIVEGNHGNWIWVILEGTVEISTSTPKGPFKVLRISDGAFVGSIGSFLADDSVRTVTAKAIGNVQLGMLDSQGLSAEFHRMAPEFRAVVKSLDRRLKEITASAAASYQGLNDPQRVLQDKRPVITETKNNDRGFLITGGRAIVARKLASGMVPLVPLIKGDFIGQLPFLDMGLEPSSAIVLGEKNLKVAPINLAAMQKEYDQLSATFKNILENIATCILATSMVTCELEKKAASNAPT
jgi:CRP-like cAMP-binding protein